MLPAHPEAAQGGGGQRTSPEIADARQAHPRSPRFAPDAAGKLAAWLALLGPGARPASRRPVPADV